MKNISWWHVTEIALGIVAAALILGAVTRARA
jgi:hypothetical protein